MEPVPTQIRRWCTMALSCCQFGAVEMGLSEFGAVEMGLSDGRIDGRCVLHVDSVVAGSFRRCQRGWSLAWLVCGAVVCEASGCQLFALACLVCHRHTGIRCGVFRWPSLLP